MSYKFIDQHRQRIDLEKAEETARDELKKALQEIRGTELPRLIGFAGGVDERLIIRADNHRQAIRTLLERLPDEQIDVEDAQALHKKATDIVEKIDSFEAAKKAVIDFRAGNTNARGGKKDRGSHETGVGSNGDGLDEAS